MTDVAFVCPRCGYAMDAATAVAGGRRVKPKAGDITLCLKCGAPCELMAEGPGRWLTFAEVAALSAEERAEIFGALIMILTMRPSAVRAIPYPEGAVPSDV